MPERKRHRSIRRQVLVFTLLITFAILVTTGGVLFFHHLTQTRERLAESLRVTAQMTATNAYTPMSFGDRRAAGENLAALHHDPLIVSAVLYDAEDQVFATFGEPVARMPDPGSFDPTSEILVPVVFDRQVLGKLLVLTNNRAELRRTAITWASVYGGAILLTTLLASLIATLFQRAVAAPLSALARTAKAVTDRNDYTVRAAPSQTTEVAALAEAFNTMLVEIGRRDAELARQLTALNKEVKEREAAEDSLKQKTRELLRLSHEAGMAEVATGVLHNIGNALNSINVSAELLADHLTGGARNSATALRAFFQTPPPKAAPVFSSHPQGPEVLAFASSHSTHATDQIDFASQELATLRTGVAHLKDIVARQQALAKSVRHSETFDLRDAVQEALLLDKTGGHSGGPRLRIEQTCEGSPLVLTDRSAVVQILVNLFANARAALASAPSPLLRVRIGPPSASLLPISVTDNGVGIHPHQLVSIFSYGFTTKAGGHGFGLHNAANTARLLGGALRVRSDGPGRGAVFTLELPRQPTESAAPSSPSTTHDA